MQTPGAAASERARQSPPSAEAARGRPLLAVGALSVGTFAFVTTEMLPIGLLPLIGADLGRSLSGTGLLVTAYAVVVVLLSLPLTVATRHVPRRILLGGLLAVFAGSVLASALAPTFGLLLAARIVTAVAQALFWSIATSTAVGRFPAHRQARVVGALFAGSALGPVVGLPVGTWIGQQFGWRVAFGAVSVVAVVTCAAVVAALPTVRPDEEPARTADAPDRRRYLVLLVTVALAVTGMFTAYTYVTAHLVDVAGLPASALGAVLLVAGIAGVGGAVASGTVLQGRERTSLLLPLASMAAALWLLQLGGRNLPAAVAAFTLLSFAGSTFAAGLAGRVLLVAPGITDVAAAGSSSAYNAGIAAGAAVGGLLAAGAGGVHATALGGALFSTAALALMLCEPWLAPSAKVPSARVPPAKAPMAHPATVESASTPSA